MDKKLEVKLLLLSALTFLIWFLNLHTVIGVAIYLGLFAYLYFKKAPLTDFLVVLLYSVMSVRSETIFNKMDFIIISVLFAWILIKNIKDKYFAIGNVLIPLLVYWGYGILTILWAPDKLLVLWGIATAIEGYMMYYLVTNGKLRIEKHQFEAISKIATFIMLTLTLELLVVYLNKGFTFVFRGDASAKWWVNVGWGYSNLIAVIYTFCIPVALYKYLNRKHFYLIYLFLDLIGLFGLILTQSRGAYLGAFVSLILFGVFYVRWDFLKKYGSIVLAMFLGSLIVPQIRSIVLLILSKFTNPQTYFNIYSDQQRLDLFNLGIKKFLEHPIFGTGLKSSRYYILTELDQARYHYHNFILQTISTLGIIGLILLIILIIRWFKVLNKRKEPFVMIVAFTLIGALVHQLFDISFDYYYFGIYFWGLLGIIEVYRHYLPDDSLKMKIKK